MTDIFKTLTLQKLHTITSMRNFLLKFRQQMWRNPQENVDLLLFTKEIFHAKLHFFCSVTYMPFFFNSCDTIFT